MFFDLLIFLIEEVFKDEDFRLCFFSSEFEGIGLSVLSLLCDGGDNVCVVLVVLRGLFRFDIVEGEKLFIFREFVLIWDVGICLEFCEVVVNDVWECKDEFLWFLDNFWMLLVFVLNKLFVIILFIWILDLSNIWEWWKVVVDKICNGIDWNCMWLVFDVCLKVFVVFLLNVWDILLENIFGGFNFFIDCIFMLKSLFGLIIEVWVNVESVCGLVFFIDWERSIVFIIFRLFFIWISVDLFLRMDLELFKVSNGCDIRMYCGVVLLVKMLVFVLLDIRIVLLEVIFLLVLLLLVMLINLFLLEWLFFIVMVFIEKNLFIVNVVFFVFLYFEVVDMYLVVDEFFLFLFDCIFD